MKRILSAKNLAGLLSLILLVGVSDALAQKRKPALKRKPVAKRKVVKPVPVKAERA